jgi:hypothetical protein
LVVLWPLIPIILSAFTHISNPVDFPSGSPNDEGIYLRRTMHVLEGLTPQEFFLYDHPYFSQLFLAAVFSIIGYPESLNPIANGDVHSIEMLITIPRMLMGILALVDTFLIYKIASLCYDKNVGFVASVLFAVMPISYLIRWTLLEPIQLPFILLSVLFALYVNKRKDSTFHAYHNKKSLLILISGIFLGLAIFTKIPAFTMIPLVGFLVYTNKGRSLKALVLWFIPIILIPMIWPAHALLNGHFDLWMLDIYSQTQRANNTFFYSIYSNFNSDPVFVILAIIGLAFAIIKKDLLILLWTIPFLIFIFIIGFVSHWHFVPLLPAFCIAAARLIMSLANKIIAASKKSSLQKILPIIILAPIAIFGLTSTAILITTSDNSSYIKAIAFISQSLHNNNNDKVTIISNPFYLWIPEYVFHLDHEYIGYYDSGTPVKTKKVFSILDSGMEDGLRKHTAGQQIIKMEENSNLYSKSKIASFQGNEYKENKDKVSIYQYQLVAPNRIGEFLTYRNSTLGLRIDYPSNWEKETYHTSQQGGVTNYIRFNSQYENPSDKFSENIEIGIENVSERQISQAQYVDSVVADMKGYYESFNIVELNRITVMGANNSPAYKIVYAFTPPEWEYGESINIKAMEVGTLVNGKVYYITYSAELKKYSDYLPIAQKMIGSFELIRQQ